MGNVQRKWIRISAPVLLGLVIVAPFQACTRLDFKSVASLEETKTGGEGFDGKIFWSYGPCAKQIGVSDVVIVSNDDRQANLTRQNCQDLSNPQALPINDLKFTYRDSTVFEMKGKVFDQQVDSGHQKITGFVCNSAGAAVPVQTLIWSGGGNLLGSVSQRNGLSSGPLSVEPPLANSLNRYVTTNGQASQFDLNLGGAMNYSIEGGASINVAQMNCSTQSSPVKLVQSSSGATIGSSVTYRFNTAATRSGDLLVVSLSILDPSTQACTIGIVDNAPGGGNVYVSAGAFAADTAAGSTDIWYAPNSRAGATSLTITLDSRCSGARPAAYFAEFAGMATVDPLETVGMLNNQPASVMVRAPQVTTASARSVVFSIASVQTSVTGIQNGSSFVALPIVDGDGAAYYISTSAGSYGVTWTQNTSGRYCSSSAVFKAAW